jgi:two-component system sensor histidine kinase HydH
MALNLKFRYLSLVFIFLAFLLILNAVIEYHQSKSDLYQLLQSQARSLLRSLIISSESALITNGYLMNLSETRLLNNAHLIRRLYQEDRISNAILAAICKENDIFRINIFNKSGDKLFSSHDMHLSGRHPSRELLKPLFAGDVDTLIIGIRQARLREGQRYAVALAAHDRSAIVLNIDAQQLLDFKSRTGFGALLRSIVARNEQIIYAALQDTSQIMAASGNVETLETINESTFLSQAIQDSLFLSRTIAFNTQKVFEAVQPFIFDGTTIGLFRLGISLESLQEINDRIYRRLLIITIFLIVIGSIVISYFLTRQRLAFLQRRYQEVETYSGNIIENVSDAILVIDEQTGIKIYNAAAADLFQQERKNMLGKSLTDFLEGIDCPDLISDSSQLSYLACTIAGEKRYLLLSKTFFLDRDAHTNHILVIRDITRQKKMEEQLEMQKRMTAMGELAAGVAHEIRNPLNTIATIVQQLAKDFKPMHDREEYHDLAKLVFDEVKRIDETVKNFLRFARPEPLQPRLFKVQKLLEELKIQYSPLLSKRQIELSIHQEWQGEVVWDYNQMKQVLINLMDNAMDAIDQSGHLSISVQAGEQETIVIKVIDNGAGIPEEIKPRIFNLYFTTKAQGTGIGLSLVQQIIHEHHGQIFVESESGKGTTFTINLPVRIG